MDLVNLLYRIIPLDINGLLNVARAACFAWSRHLFFFSPMMDYEPLKAGSLTGRPQGQSGEGCQVIIRPIILIKNVSHVFSPYALTGHLEKSLDLTGFYTAFEGQKGTPAFTELRGYKDLIYHQYVRELFRTSCDKSFLKMERVA